MKKILISANNLDIGGIETSLINLLKNMDLNKYDITLYLEEKKGVFLKDVPKEIIVKEYKTCKSKNIIIRKFKNLLNRFKFLINNYKKYDASICYATYSGPGSLIARNASNNRTIFVHSNYFKSYNDINITKAFFNKIKINKYNHIVFVSNESKNDFLNIYPKMSNKSYVINNLIDNDKIMTLSKNKIDIKKNNKKIFLFVGRLDESSKRLTLLLDTAKECMKKKIDATFWLIGDGPDKEKYEKLIKEYKLDNVLMLGAKSNPYPYIKACDYLILTSNYEGFPVVYNEAIILNKPIITTIDVSDDYISIPDRFGYVCKPNAEDITNTINNVIKKPFVIKEQIDFNNLNKKRIEKIEELLENKND